MPSTKRESEKKNLSFNTALLIISLAILGVSIYTLTNVNQIKSAAIPKTIAADEFLNKLTSHSELSSYKNINPLNIMTINLNNLAALQTQIQGLDTSNVGDYIVRYDDRLIIYNFKSDIIKGNFPLQIQQTQQTQNIPQDFFTKLNKHAELQGLETISPTGGIIDQTTLDALRQQNPGVYDNVVVGNFLLRYPNKIIVYNYEDNKIVKAIDLTTS